MVEEWFHVHPWGAGIVTFFLMWSDWLFTVWQQKERETYRSDRTQTYPVDAIEGNPILQEGVRKRSLFHTKHLLASMLVAISVTVGIAYAPFGWHAWLLGYVWGLFLIVDSTHVGNLLAYRACRRGAHGQLWLHQRTALLVQAGRYMALTGLLFVLALVSTSPFVFGTALAGGTSAFRQWVWLRRTPVIPLEDRPPSERFT